MKPINKTFAQCPSCGSKARFLETLANDMKKEGYARKDWSFYYDIRQGVVVDQAKVASIPVGASVPSYAVATDICLDCGTVYAIRLQSGEAKKSLAPPKIIVPGQGTPFGQESPFGNDPRFS